MKRRSFLRFLSGLLLIPVFLKKTAASFKPKLEPRDFVYVEGFQAFPLQKIEGKTFCVGQGGIDDLTNDGSIMKPFATINFASSQCKNSSDCIVILRGHPLPNGLRTIGEK